MSKDRAIIAGLIFTALIELFLLLAHTGILQISRETHTEGLEAGRILRTHNHLRRRNLNSLVWETSESNEPVYFYDSILTLSESSATLELNGTTDISLSENTLITIDPPEDSHTGEIRLRFSRGHLAARNPYQEAQVKGEDWSLAIKPGTDLEVRDVGTDNIEVNLKSGAASLSARNGSHDLKVMQILRVTPTGTEYLKIDQHLSWEHSPPRRVYIHAGTYPALVQWSGDADRLSLQSLGQAEKVIPLPDGAHSYLVDLPLGNHRLYVRNTSSSSAPMDIQVWRAPLIHLLQPLPRNRVDLGQNVTFMWQYSPQMQGYRFHLIGGPYKIDTPRDNNAFAQTFDIEADAQWYVEGIDPEGYSVPPLYRYPLFLREKPFAPPLLNSPELRAPASKPAVDKGAWLWNWLLPQAHADADADEAPLYEARFSWEPVPGANLYVIEISESADFREPIVNTVVKKNSVFIWQAFALKKYHWRVAAGSSRGRMGIFSDSAVVDFTLLTSGYKANVNGVEIHKRVNEPKPPVPEKVVVQVQPTGPESTLTESTLTERPLSEAQRRSRPILLWQPLMSAMAIPGTEDSHATFQGLTPTSFAFKYPLHLRHDALWLLSSTLRDFNFKVTDRNQYPFQRPLHWMEISFNALYFSSSVGYGLSAKQLLSLTRSQSEAVAAHTALWFGPAVEKSFPLTRGELNLRFEALFSGDGQALTITPEWHTSIGPRFILGVGTEATTRLQVPNLGWTMHGYVTFGLSF